METFDAIVVGLGAHGSAAAAALARRGLRVLGLERFGRGETYGSSGGRSRMIRLAHFENPAYTPLALASWERWLALEREATADLLTVTGGLYAGPPDSLVVTGARATAAAHTIAHEVVDAAAIRRRWPAFTPGDDVVAVVEEGAGMLRADRANEAHLRIAERSGADLRFNARLVDWRPADGGGFEVETDEGAGFGSAFLVLTTGPWTTELVPDLELPLVVERQPVCWFQPTVPFDDVSVGRLPIWLFDTPAEGTFYGFPLDPEIGLKVSHHHSGQIVAAETVDREVRPADLERIRSFIRARMPAAAGPLTHATVCLYTNTPDDEFVIDLHPAAPGVAFASACSGHGYKFAPIVGEILADLATTGTTAWPIEAFRADRFREVTPR